jgi:hypothetical protein
MENQLKLKIKIGQVEFEAEGDANAVTEQRDVFIQSIVPAASSFLDKIQSIEAVRVAESPTNSQIVQNETATSALPYSNVSNNIDWSRTNLVSFLNKYGELSDRDFVLFAAYYYERKQQGEKYTFTLEDVKKFYSEARRSLYSNPSQLLYMLVKAGFIIDDQDAKTASLKSYVISQDGLQYINTYIPKEKTEKKARKAPATRKKVESIYASLNADELNLSKYPAIKDLKSSKDKIIMAMYIVTTEKKGTWFLATDVEFIMLNVFNEHITLKQIQNTFDRNRNLFAKQQSVSNKKANEYRLLSGATNMAETIILENTTK